MNFLRVMRLRWLSGLGLVLVGATGLSAQAPGPAPSPPRERMQIPAELPGSQAPPLQLPPLDPNKPAEREQAIRKLYPALPPLRADTVPALPPTGAPWTLAQLQDMALGQNPVIQQARADVQSAYGQAIQAGLYPNPVLGYQGDQMAALDRSGQQGGFVEIIFKTANKLGLARAAGMIGYFNALLALRRTEFDLVAQVRTNYFQVLVAHETVVVNRALARLAEEAYRIQIAQVQGGQAAAYEPLQLYVLAVQARGNLVQAQNRYLSAWRQLAASLSQPNLPPMLLAGRADAPIPEYPYETAKSTMLRNHTDMATAHNNIVRAQYQLRLAEVTPIPDISTHTYMQRDNTDIPTRIQYGVQAGIAIPIFDRNQGNIRSAQSHLAYAQQDVKRVENDLNQRLAEAYERYGNNKVLVGYYRDQVLPNQVRVYRALQQRYQQEPDKVSYNDIVVAQQTLANSLTAYLTALSAQWTAVVDVANLMQSADLFAPGVCPSTPTVCLDDLLPTLSSDTLPAPTPAPASTPPPPVPAPQKQS